MVVAEGSWAGAVLPGALVVGVGCLGRALVRLAVGPAAGEEEGVGRTVGNWGLRGLGREE